MQGGKEPELIIPAVPREILYCKGTKVKGKSISKIHLVGKKIEVQKIDLVFEKPVKGRLTGSLYEQERIPGPAVKFEDELFLSVGELSQPKLIKF